MKTLPIAARLLAPSSPAPRRLRPVRRFPFGTVTAALVGATLCCLAGARAQAPTFSFTSLVDTNTGVPGQTGTMFTGFGSPVIQGGNVIFQGTNSSYTAIYTTPASALALSSVVDTNTTAPGHGTTFTNVINPTLSGGNAAFAGIYSGGSGVYTASGGGAVVPLADRGGTVPGQTFATYSSFTGGPTVSGGNAAFYANYINANGDGTGIGSGIYNGAVGATSATLVADRNTVAPGSSTGAKFTGFAGTPNISGNTTAFQARFGNGTGQSGVYTSDPVNGLKTIADTSTLAPGGNGATFSGFNSQSPVISGSSVLFHGTYSGGQGLYLGTAGATGGVLPIAAIGTPVPGQTGQTITSFGTSYALSGTNAVFSATFSGGGQGILLEENGALYDVLNVGDPIAGGSLYFYSLSQDALDGNQLTFSYLLNSSTGPSGIEVVTIVPEPATWLGGAALAGLAAWAGTRRVRRAPDAGT